MSLVQMTLSGGAFILFIVVVRALALYRLPKGAFLALWEMAALRLLLPFTLPLPFSLFAPAKHLPVVGDYLTAGGAAVPGTPAVGIPAGTSASAGTDPGAVLTMVWLAGAALMAAYFTVSYVRARRRFRASTPDDTPAVRRWLAGRTPHRPLEVRRSALVTSPLTYGVLRPVILLPEDMERVDETALTYILTHEYIHLRRFDSVAKLAFSAALCVHWFNPLAWVMYVLANRDLELSCDERVMDTLDGGEKASYALTLINMEEARSRCFSPYNHFNKLAIEERIEAIMKYKKKSIFCMVLAIVLVSTVAVGFAAEPESPQPNLHVPMCELVPGNSGHIVPEVTADEAVDENAPKTELVAGKGEDILNGERSVSISTDFTVKVGKSFERTFKTDVLFGEDHDAFSVIVTDTNGVPYKMIAENSTGWSSDTPEMTGDQTWYFWNVSGKNTYTIYIQNLGTSELTGHVKISSYYHSDV